MFDIDERIMKRNCGDLVYNKGLDLYLRNKVRQIDVDISGSDEDSTKLLYIDSVVESSLGNENFVSKIIINDKAGTMKAHCQCEYSVEGNICKHIVAAALKWSREKEDILKRNKLISSSKTNNFIEAIKGSLAQHEVKRIEARLKVKYEFEPSKGNLSSIELKVGEDKGYIVKNMREFLSAIKNKDREIEFGKNFTFNPSIHSFNSLDQEILDIFLEIYEADNKLSYITNSFGRFYGENAKFISGKKIYLTDQQVKRFLKLIKDKIIDGVISGEDVEELKVVEEDMPLEFYVDVDGKGINIGHEDKIPLQITDDGEFYYYKGRIYCPSERQRNIYRIFFKEIEKSKNNAMFFDRDDSEKVASYIISGLKKISHRVIIDKSFEKDLYEEPIKTGIYLDKEEGSISADVIFKYGELEINPFNEGIKKREEKVLIRDIEQEMKVIGILEAYGFKKDIYRFTLKDEEEIIDFLVEGIIKLQELGEVYYSDSFKEFKVYTPSNIKSSIRLNNEDLLEFNFTIEGIDQSELKDIFYSLRQKRKYHKLKKGGFVALDNKEIQDIGTIMEYLDIKESDFEKDTFIFSKYNAMYIDQHLKNNNMFYVERNRRFRELVNNIKDVQETDYLVPEHLQGIMRNYQKFGFKWLKTLAHCGFGGILADEMGLGKTLQTIAFIESEIMEDKTCRKPSLVVAPTSLVYNWKNEIEKFSPKLKALVISGSKNEREEQRKEIDETDIVITSYSLIRRDIEEYAGIDFKYCFLDEAQQIKNPLSMSAQAVKEIKAQGYFALTGTPIENSLTELWSIFDFMMPGYLLSHGRFLKKYESPIVKDKNDKALQELNKHIRPFILRRLKKEVVKELPPKIEHKIIVEMTEEQKKLYASYVEASKEEISSEIRYKGLNRSKIKILSVLTRLRQICCEPSIFIENFTGESGKMLALDELVEESIGAGHRILLFSQFTSVLKLISKRISDNGIDFMYLDGATKAEDRTQMVNDFNLGKSDIFLISLKAGGTGLNLTGADVVIHFDPWWNPAVEDQASDRAHRIGQKNTVEVIKLITRGTIEEKIFKLQERKKDIINSVLGSENFEETLISGMTEEEIEELFTI